MRLTRRGLFAWFGGGAALAVVAGVPAARSSVITRPGLFLTDTHTHGVKYGYVTLRDNPFLRGTRYAAALDALPEPLGIQLWAGGVTWVDASFDP